MIKVKIKKLKNTDNNYKLEIIGTQGWMLSIRNALAKHAEVSPVAKDVLDFLLKACLDSDINLD